MIGPASRRGLLRGLAGVSAIGGTVALPALVQAEPVKDGELKRLGAELDRAFAEYVDLVADKERRITAFEFIKPEIPESIVRRRQPHITPQGYVQLEFYGDHPPSHDGSPCGKATDGRVRVLWPCEAEAKANEHRDQRTLKGKRYRFLHRESEAYFAAHEKARQTAGLPTAEEARWFKGREVLNVAFRIMATHATGTEGLAVKGRAGLAMDSVWQGDGPTRMEDSYRKLLTNLVALGGVQP